MRIMYHVVIFLVSLATTTVLGKTRAHTTIYHAAKPLEPLYEKYYYKERDYNRYPKHHRYELLDQVPDYDNLSDELIHVLELQKTLANTVKRGHFKTTNRDKSIFDVLMDRDDTVPDLRIRKHGTYMKGHLTKKVPRIVDNLDHIVHNLKTIFPSRPDYDDPVLRQKYSANPRHDGTVMSTEYDGDTSDINDSVSGRRSIEYEDNVGTGDKNKHSNKSDNGIDEIKTRPSFRIDPRGPTWPPPSPLPSKFDPPPYFPYDYRDLSKHLIDGQGDDRAGDNIIESDKKTDNEDTRKVKAQWIKNGRTDDINFTNTDSEKTSTAGNVDDFSQTETIDEARTYTTREPIDVVTTAIPGINFTKDPPRNSNNNGKKSEKIRHKKHHKRHYRKKNKKRPPVTKNQSKLQVHSEQEQDDFSSPSKMDESTAKDRTEVQDKIKGGESKDKEVTGKEDEPKDNSDATSTPESPEEGKNDGEKGNPLKVDAPEDLSEQALLGDRNGSSLNAVEPTLKPNANTSLDELKLKMKAKEVVTPSYDNEDLEENSRDNEEQRSTEDDKLELKKMTTDSHASGNAELEIHRSKPKPDRIALQKKSNVKKDENTNGIGDPSRISRVVLPVETKTHRKSTKNKNIHKNVNRVVSTNGNNNDIQTSDVTNFVQKDEADDDDDKESYETMRNRRKMSENANKNFEESDDRSYEMVRNKKLRERLIHDDTESNDGRKHASSVNKNTNVNRNVGPSFNRHTPRRVVHGKNVKPNPKSVEDMLEEVNQLQKQVAEKEAESKDDSRFEDEGAMLQQTEENPA